MKERAERAPGKRLSIIFAIAKNGVIGREGELPWNYPEDRAYFLRMTKGHAVIMGRRTWEERGAPLPDRTNIVVSTTFARPAEWPDVVVARNFDLALRAAWAIDDEPFVIGGARLIEEALPLASRVYVTEIPGTPQGDTFLRFDRGGLRVVDERRGSAGLSFLVFEPRRHPS